MKLHGLWKESLHLVRGVFYNFDVNLFLLNFVKAASIALILLLGNGCCTVMQSQVVIDNVGRYYVAIEPTKKVYLTKDRAYVEFRKAHYTDDVPLRGECIRFSPNLVIDNSKPKSLVYLEMDKNSVLPKLVAQQVSNNLTNLLERKDILSKLTHPVDFPYAANVLKGDWDDFYPTPIESYQSTLWYALAPAQVPAFVADLGATLVAVTVVIVCSPINYVWDMFEEDDRELSIEETVTDK
jgi:hypothetical protein